MFAAISRRRAAGVIGGSRAGTPPAIVNRINATMNQQLANPEFGQRLMLQGVEPVTSTPQGMRDMIASELARWRKVIKDAGISVETAQ